MFDNREKKTIMTELATTSELLGTVLSKNVLAAFMRELEKHEVSVVIAALHRCQRECKHRLTIADVISRIEDGHLSADEAWALCPWSENDSTVWTDEIEAAFFAALPIFENRDPIAARMAFKQRYEHELVNARANGISPRWKISFGHSVDGRERAIIDAIKNNRITREQAIALLPNLQFADQPAITQNKNLHNVISMIAAKKKITKGKNNGN